MDLGELTAIAYTWIRDGGVRSHDDRLTDGQLIGRALKEHRKEIYDQLLAPLGVPTYDHIPDSMEGRMMNELYELW